MTAIQTNLMQCAAYGLSTDMLTPPPPPPPHPFNLCSNARSTHTSISKTQPLDMMLSTCTQLLWSTMARPVLNGTRPVKPLYGLGSLAPCCSSVSGSWQSSYSLHHLYVKQQSFFFRSSEISLPWGAMLNFQWPVCRALLREKLPKYGAGSKRSLKEAKELSLSHLASSFFFFLLSCFLPCCSLSPTRPLQ